MHASTSSSYSDQSRRHPTVIPNDASSDVGASNYTRLSSDLIEAKRDHLLCEGKGLAASLERVEIRYKRKVCDISTTHHVSKRSSKSIKGESAMESTHQMSSLQRMMKMEEANRAETNDQRALADVDPSFHKQAWRERVAQWCYDVLDYLEESRDVAAVAMNIIDRYLAVLWNEPMSPTSLEIGEFDYEVISFTALFLAIRVSGSNKELEISELLKLSSRSGAPQVKHIVSAGNSMLEKLSWNRQLLTPNSFLRELFALLVKQHEKEDCIKALADQSVSTLIEFASYLVEISVCDIYFSALAPSKIAFGALALAMMCHSELFLNGCRHEEFLSCFFESVHEETSMNIECPEMSSILSRLLHVYNQSQEAAVQNIESEASQMEGSANDGTYETGTPHVIIDEEGDNGSECDSLNDRSGSGPRGNANTRKTRPVSPLPLGFR